MGRTGTAAPAPRLGLAANATQFGLMVAVNALVGDMPGQGRTWIRSSGSGTSGSAAAPPGSPSSLCSGSQGPSRTTAQAPGPTEPAASRSSWPADGFRRRRRYC